jgi:hypothetical protein
MEKWTFLQLAEHVLGELKRPATPSEIWKYATQIGIDKKLASQGKTPSQTLYASLYLDVKDRGSESLFVVVGSKPKKWYLKSLPALRPAQIEQIKASSPPELAPAERMKEKDLHPHCVYFARTKLGAFVKTISHSKSSKGGYAEWIHPDLVGGHFAHEDWLPEVTELSSVMGLNTSKLYSFELKLKLDYSNLRESFFQAVSNSSWAHQGYLVAAEIEEGVEFRDDLARLSASFGIGIIRLDIGEPDASEIMFVARSREMLDLETVNMLADKNADFRAFLEAVHGDISTKRTIDAQYDPVPPKETLLARVTVKKGLAKKPKGKRPPHTKS